MNTFIFSALFILCLPRAACNSMFATEWGILGSESAQRKTSSTESLASKFGESNYIKTGTTIVGVCCNDGIVLGADTRCTGGPLIVDKDKLKIHPIAARIFCCAAGTSAHCDKITRKAAQELALLRVEKEISGELNFNQDLVSSALISIQNTIRNPVSKKRNLQSVFILGGVDSSGPSLFQVDSEGASLQVGFASLG